MRKHFCGAAAFLMLAWSFGALPAVGQARGGRGFPAGPVEHPYDPSETDPPPIVTHHQIVVGGQTLQYTATTGRMPVPDAAGKTEAHIFYVAYTLDNAGDKSKRPLSFLYNGGPGEPAIWVHMGGFGPRRIVLNDDGTLPPSPYSLTDNEETWLPFTDMVFIDPTGTGYSRAVSEAALRYTSGVAGDLQSLGEFIRLYLSNNDRMSSPFFIGGESYGTFRSAGLAGYLVQRGYAPQGVILLSSVLNMATLSGSLGDDRPYILFLPTMTAAAWFHKKLPADLENLTVQQATQQCEQWAEGPYQSALFQGDALVGAARQQAIDGMARCTGLSHQFIDDYNLRVAPGLFESELLRDQKLIIGRLDGRMTSFNRVPGQQSTDFDASWTQRPVYTQMFTQYVRDELGYKTDDIYGGGIDPWDYGAEGQDMSGLLESAFAKDPYLHLMLGSGMYDFATPFFEADYSMNHLFLSPETKKNIVIHHYEVGHMIYQRTSARQQLRDDVRAFIQEAAKPGPPITTVR